MAKSLSAMNAHVGSIADLANKDFIFEPKLDGYRALCYVNRTVRFISRNGIDLTQDYPELAIRPFIKAKNAVLDGEIMAFDSKGNPNFAALQQGKTAYFAVFDILMKDNRILIDLPLLERKKILEKTVIQKQHLYLIPFTEDGKKLWKEIIKHDAEGVMAKKKDSRYFPGIRSWSWLKIKTQKTIDCIIIGYTKQKREISSLALALYDSKKKLHYIGKVGTGFNQESIETLDKQLKTLKHIPNPFPELTIRGVFWVQPKLVCEVSYHIFTAQMRLRISSFKRLRPDKKPIECTFKEQAFQ